MKSVRNSQKVIKMLAKRGRKKERKNGEQIQLFSFNLI